MDLFRGLSRRYVVLAIGAVCFCVLMQLIGDPATLWDPDLEGNLFETPVTDDLAMVVGSLLFNPLPLVSCIGETHPERREIVLSHSVFHPPCLRS